MVYKSQKHGNNPDTYQQVIGLRCDVYVYIYIHVDIYSVIKREWNIAISSNMDGPREYHTK